MRWLPILLCCAPLLSGCWKMGEAWPGAGDGGTDDGTDDTTGGPTDPDTSTNAVDECTLEVLDSPTTEDLTAIWGAAADDIHAVGADGTILRYDGDAWAVVEHDIPGNPNLHSIAGADATHVWAGGADRTMLHFDGATWTLQETVFSIVPGAYRGLCAVDQHEAYAVGEGETIIVLDDWGWSFGKQGSGGADYHSAWCGVGDDVYIAGHDHAAYVSSELLRYSPPHELEALDHEPIDNMYGITADESGQIWAVGFTDGVGSKLYHLSGDDWTVELTSEHELLALWAHSEHGLWAAGNTAADDSLGVIQSWRDGEPLCELEHDGTWRFRGIWGVEGPSGPRVYAVGKEGVIVRLAWPAP